MIIIDNNTYETYSSSKTLEKFREYKKNPTEELRNEIIIGNIKLVNFFIRKFADWSGIEKKALESYAYEGLIKAVDNYDIESGYMFSTFAKKVIYNLFGKVMNEIYFSCKNATFWSEWNKMKQKVEKDNQTTVEEDVTLIDEILQNLVSIGKLKSGSVEKKKKQLLICYCESLDKVKIPNPFNNDDELDIYNETNDDIIFEEKIIEEALIKDLNESLKKLDPRQLEIIKLHYGLYGYECLSLKEIGKKFNISKQHTNRIERKALKRIKNSPQIRYYIDR